MAVRQKKWKRFAKLASALKLFQASRQPSPRQRRPRSRSRCAVFASNLVFATGHNAKSETLPDWAGLALKGATVAVYMGRTVAAAVAEKMIGAGLKPETPVAVIENAAHPDERQFAGTLSELAVLSNRAEIDGPVLIVIGEAVGHAAMDKAESLAPQLAARVVAA